MWWLFFTIFFLISVVTSTLLFYSLRRINQYEDLILQFQTIINIATEKMKFIDEKGSFEADDEVGFFFNQLKDLQLLLDDIFETEKLQEEQDGQKKEKR